VFEAQGTLDNAEWNRAPTVGAGPFVFAGWEAGDHLSFVANPNWIHPPRLAQIDFRFAAEDTAREALVASGAADIGTSLTADQVGRLAASGTAGAVALPVGFDEALFLNVNPDTAHPAMLDANVRAALALATDRFSIVRELLDETLNPVNAGFWDSTPPYGPHPNLQPYPYDPEFARALLDEAGWVDSDGDGTRDKDGVELVLRYITTQREIRQTVQARVQEQWAAVGIGAELVTYPSSVFWNTYDGGGPQAQGLYDVAQWSQAGRFPDPEASYTWRCDEIASAANPDGNNWQGYCSPALDALLREQAVTLDLAARVALYHRIEVILYDEVLYIGLWRDPDVWSVSHRLAGLRPSGVTPLWNAHEWTVQP
jgi:peptide/nickel transport system substrate-binding protein